MRYKYYLTFTPTNGSYRGTPRLCHPVAGDDLSIVIAKESDEWYYTRKLDGRLTFLRNDYAYIMGCDFDGVFKLEIQESHDRGESWNSYFTGTFSRANLEIDADNQSAVLNGLTEGIYNVINNGKNDEYDLRKIIPDTQAKEVQGEIWPALAMVDYRSASISSSDVYCNGASTAGGYDSKHPESGYNENNKIESDDDWNFVGIYAEAKVKMKSGHADADGLYAGVLQYSTRWTDYFFPVGTLECSNGSRIEISAYVDRDDPSHPVSKRRILIYDPDGNEVDEELDVLANAKQSPSSVEYDYSDAPQFWLDKLTIYFHYIRATLLTTSADGVGENILDVGPYYKGMRAFEGSGLTLAASARTVQQANGHGLVPGSDTEYFAPPDNDEDWIPLAEFDWTYGSLWYKIVPSVQNGLLDTSMAGSFRWTCCWTVGTCLAYLLDKVTGGKVVFAENSAYSRFLYDQVNPVAFREPFSWLVTQKSNVMRPGASGAARCVVTLNWFLELLRNAFNCYYWLEKRNDGTYDFRVEHVEFLRQGGSYTEELDYQDDLTELYPYRNFKLHNDTAAKRLSNLTNRWSYDLKDVSERYTFSWQGDGGSDDFKGYPMLFKAGWIESGTSESHEVDNIFADLAWLMLNAGSDVQSSNNFSGLFLFAGYQAAYPDLWSENQAPAAQYLTLTDDLTRSDAYTVSVDVWLTIPSGASVTLASYDVASGVTSWIGTYNGLGQPQLIQIDSSLFPRGSVAQLDFGTEYADIIIHRVRKNFGNLFRVANTENLLRPGYYLQNGPLAWPSLQFEYLHYDIPSLRWSYNSDEIRTAIFLTTGTLKLAKKQSVGVFPVPTGDPDPSKGIKTELGTGIIEQAKINLASRNCELSLIYPLS